MGRHFVVFLSISVYLFVFSVTPAFAERRLTCESRNYRYVYCPIRTGGYVRIDREYSAARCVFGRTWGYDWRGVWVDGGCRARFLVGNHHLPRDRDDDDVAAALGTAIAIIGSAAILGALLNNSYDQQSPYSGGTTPSANSSFGVESSSREAVPSWAVGTFAGYNALYNSELELTIDTTGRVKLKVDGEELAGIFSHGRILMEDGGELVVTQDASGVKTTRRDVPESVVRYVRIR